MKERLLDNICVGLYFGTALLICLGIFSFLTIFAFVIGVNGGGEAMIFVSKMFCLALVFDAVYILYQLVRYLFVRDKKDEEQ